MLKLAIFSILLCQCIFLCSSQGISIPSLTHAQLQLVAPSLIEGCASDQECADVCTPVQNGAGVCTNGQCQCSACPLQTLTLGVTVHNVCAVNVACSCPVGGTQSISYDYLTGRIRGGHLCIYGNKLMCMCFCAGGLNPTQFLNNQGGCPFAYL